MDSEEAVKRSYQDGECGWLSAIMRLEDLGYEPKAAEAKVEEWAEWK